MSEEELNKIIARRILYYIEQKDMTQLELSRRLHVSPSTVSDWVKAKKAPRFEKLDAMSEIFGCSRSDLMQEKTEQQYYDEETAAIAQDIRDNTDLRLLLSAAKDVSPETIKDVHNYLLYLKNKELHLDD